MHASTVRRVISRPIALLAIVSCVVLPAANAATITPETLAAWNQQVQNLRFEVERDAADPTCFIHSPSDALHVSSPHASGRPIPSGLIHYWIGITLLPHAHTDDVLAVLQDYNRYAQVFQPATVESHLTGRSGDTYSYRLKFIQKAMGVRTGLVGDFQSTYVRINDRSGYSLTEATTLTELQNPGESTERPISLAESHGFLEKSFTVVRYSEQQAGTMIEIDSVTLTREVPGSLRWLISPFIHRFARQTMTATLESIQTQVTAPDLTITSTYNPRHPSRSTDVRSLR